MSLKTIVSTLCLLLGVLPQIALSQDSSQFKYNYFFVIDPNNQSVDTFVSFKDTGHPEFVYLMLLASTNTQPQTAQNNVPTPVLQSHYDETYRQNYNLRVNLYNSMSQLVVMHNAVSSALKADKEFRSVLNDTRQLTAVGRTAWIQLLKNDPQLYLDLQEEGLVGATENFLKAVQPVSPSVSERSNLAQLFYASAIRSLANWRLQYEAFNESYIAL